MAGKAKSIYLSVVRKDAPNKAVMRKTFFEAKAVNAYVATDEFKEKYPLDTYQIVKETF